MLLLYLLILFYCNYKLLTSDVNQSPDIIIYTNVTYNLKILIMILLLQQVILLLY